MGALLAKLIEIAKALFRLAELARQARDLLRALKAAWEALVRALGGDEPLAT